jgi:hypothetical protein
MKRYIRQFKEQEDNETNERVIELINQLRDENWTNEEQRKKLVPIISEIALHTDKEARSFIRELGKWCKDYSMKHEKE